jgi:predicted Na+-dependent transporter
MRFLVPSAVFFLMVSVGMGLRPGQVIVEWRRITAGQWARLLVATFLAPPALALALAHLFRLTAAETIGLFMVGVAPGAPLLTRNLAKKGFDMHLAASYQVWAACMVPMMIPLVVWAAAELYEREVWIPPRALLAQVGEKQFLPLALGILAAWLAPVWAQRLQPALNVAGNLVLTLIIVLVLFKMGPAIRQISALVPVAAVLLALGAAAVVRLLAVRTGAAVRTFAICNVNRHVGLALLLSGQYLHAQGALPALACYAIVAAVVIIAYARMFRPEKEEAA